RSFGSRSGVMPHSYGASFAADGLLGPIFDATYTDATPKIVDNPNRIRIGRYSASNEPPSRVSGRGLTIGTARMQVQTAGVHERTIPRLQRGRDPLTARRMPGATFASALTTRSYASPS